MMKLLAILVAVAAATSAQASVEISSKPTHNMNCIGGVCTPTAKNADLNATDLANMLATSDVKVVTGSGAVTITVSSSFSWTSTHRLTLDAKLNVSFRASVVVAGQGAVTITYNDGGTGGDLLFFPGGKLDFWDTSSSLIVNADNYTLVGDILSLSAAVADNPGGQFALAKDYNARTDGTYREPPVNILFGTFEGLGNNIENLSMGTHGRSIGMFAAISGSAVIRDFSLTNVVISGGAGHGRRKHVKFVGSLAGQNFGSIDAVHVSTTIDVDNTDLWEVGGLVGENDGQIANSSVSGLVAAAKGNADSVGGLAGFMDGVHYSPTMINSRASVAVTGDTTTDRVGGLLGSGSGAIINCSATGSVTGNTSGGLVGRFSGRIENSFSSGPVTSTFVAGGLVGWTDTTVTNSYSLGSVTGVYAAGGLIEIAITAAEVKNSYAIGRMTGGGPPGGLIGIEIDSSSQSSTYWDTDTSGVTNLSQGVGNIPNAPGVTGLTDAQLKSELPAGFDPQVWGQSASINNGYPYLLANPPPQ